MRITRHLPFANFSSLDPGSCFLFASEGAVELGVVAKMSDGERVFVIPGPRDPIANKLPQLLPEHYLSQEEVLLVPDATIHLNAAIENVSYDFNINLDFPAALYKSSSGIYIRAIYRRSNVFWMNIMTGLVERKPHGQLFCYNKWDIRVFDKDVGLEIIQRFPFDENITKAIRPSKDA